MTDVEANRACSSCGEPSGYVLREDGSIGGTAVSECCRAPLRVNIVSSEEDDE